MLVILIKVVISLLNKPKTNNILLCHNFWWLSNIKPILKPYKFSHDFSICSKCQTTIPGSQNVPGYYLYNKAGNYLQEAREAIFCHRSVESA